MAYQWIPYGSVICGIFACKMVYDLSQVISAACFKHYRSLTKMKQVEWDNRAVSTTHAIFVMILSIYLAFWSDLYADDHQLSPVLFRSSTLSTFVLGVSVGYFISDLAMIFWFYPALGGLEYVLHHFLSMAVITYSMLIREGQFYIYLVLLSETTTPGINLRWYLDELGLKRTKAYIINGVAVFLMWLVARILLFIYLFCHIYVHYDQIKQLTSIGYLLLFTSPFVLGMLNLMWFGKITKGMLKAMAQRGIS